MKTTLTSAIKMEGFYPMMGLNIGYADFPIGTTIIKRPDNMIITVVCGKEGSTITHYIGKLNTHEKARYIWIQANNL